MPSLEFEKAEEYIIPGKKEHLKIGGSETLISSQYNNGDDLIGTMKNQILKHFPPRSAERKIFVSRSRQKFRRLINEKELEPILLKYGFEIVYFEGMPFNEQVKLMQETEILLSTHGANLVNLVFLPSTAIVIEMVNIDFTNDVYYTLAADLNLPYYAIPCTMIDETLIPPAIVLNDTAKFTDQMVALNNAHLQVDVSLVETTIKSALMHYSTKDA
jgi:capsular polysaccharide biosynthesis protein